jgi:hypothetical protein
MPLDVGCVSISGGAMKRSKIIGEVHTPNDKPPWKLEVECAEDGCAETKWLPLTDEEAKRFRDGHANYLCDDHKK